MSHKIFRGLVVAHSVLFVAVLVTGCSFSRFAKRSYERALVNKPYDAIIVPGLPYEKDKESVVLKMRMLWAKHLFDSGLANNVIFSGSAVYTPYVESLAMREIADSLGIPPSRTFSETEAEHSTENVYYSWKLAQGLGFRNVALATDPFQAAMLKSFIKKYTPGVDLIPVVYEKLDLKEVELPRINATAAYRADFVSIKERESFFQRIRGTFGRRIKEQRRMEEAREQQRLNASN